MGCAECGQTLRREHSGMTPHYQFSGGLFAALLFLAALLFFFVFLPVSIVTEAFFKLGLTPWQGVLALIVIVLGRSVNLPVFTSERLVMVPRPRTMTFGLDSEGRPMHIEQEPVNELTKQVFAVNVGGCVLPILLSASLLFSAYSAQGNALLAWVGFSTFTVAAGCYAMTKADPFTGLRVPLFMPALMTFLSVFFFAPEPIRPVAAYVAGTIGTLLGGNVAALLTPRIRNGVGTPLVSIGGAGTFGGVFLAGILAVLLA